MSAEEDLNAQISDCQFTLTHTTCVIARMSICDVGGNENAQHAVHPIFQQSASVFSDDDRL